MKLVEEGKLIKLDKPNPDLNLGLYTYFAPAFDTFTYNKFRDGVMICPDSRMKNWK